MLLDDFFCLFSSCVSCLVQSSVGNGATSTSGTTRPNGEPAVGTVVKTEPVEEAGSADTTSGSSGTNSSTFSPAPASTPAVKDGKGCSSALHWLADLATQKEPKGETKFRAVNS